MVGLKTEDEMLFEVIQSWAAKTGVWIWYKPKKGRKKVNWFDRVIIAVQIQTVLFQLKRTLSLQNSGMMLSLQALAGELDDRNIGLSSKLDEPYFEKKEKLDKLLQSLGSVDVSNAIQRHLLYSYGLNSLLLFVQYISSTDYPKWLPAKFKPSITSLTQAIDAHILKLRAVVVNQVQLYLVGKENQ